MIAAKYRGERVDFRKISELVRDVNDLYAEKGVVTAAAILPPQQLASGNLQIQLIEGRLGAAAIVVPMAPGRSLHSGERCEVISLAPFDQLQL